MCMRSRERWIELSLVCIIVFVLKVESRMHYCFFFFFFSSRRRHTRFDCDWSSDVCSSDLLAFSWSFRWPARTSLVCACSDDVKTFSPHHGQACPAYPRLCRGKTGVNRREIGRASCRERV